MATTITVSTTIDARREHVFAIVSDLSARPVFTDHFIDEFHLQRIEPTGVGASARFRIDAGRKPIRMETVIVELEPPYRILERGHGGKADRVEINTAWMLEEGAAGTEVTLVLWTEEANPFDKLFKVISRRRAERAWKRVLERLKELAESGAEVERIRVAGRPRIPVGV